MPSPLPPVFNMDSINDTAVRKRKIHPPDEERRSCIDFGQESQFPILDFSPFVRLPPIVKGKGNLTRSEPSMLAIKGNVSPTTKCKFDQLRRDHLSLNGQREGSPTSEKEPSVFSIEKSRSEWESSKSKFLQNSSSVNKYFPHLEKSVDVSQNYESPFMTQTDNPISQERNNSTRYHRSTTAPPRISRSLGNTFESNVDITAIDLVSMANEQEYKTMSNERNRCVNRTMRCHSAKTMYPDITIFHSSPRHTNLRFESEVTRTPCARRASSSGECAANKINALSMEWCDVLGPKHCYNCDKVHKRNRYGRWNDSTLETIGINTEDLSAITVVKRLIPNMDTKDILYNIADGKISRSELKREKIHDRQKDITNKPKNLSQRRISAFGVPDGLGFFLNFSDLRSQLLAEERKKKTHKGASFDVSEYITIPNAGVDIEVVGNKEKHYSNYFSPPLLSRSACPQPSFYAGGESTYQLPKAPTISTLRKKASEAMVEMEASSVVKYNEIVDEKACGGTTSNPNESP